MAKNGNGNGKSYFGYTAHPLAEMIPPMSDEQYEHLKEDIRVHGVKERVLVQGKQILDGLHRMRAASELKLKMPKLTIYRGRSDALMRSEVLSKNLHRRHLTDHQRLMLLAWGRAPQLKAEAEARKKAHGEPKEGEEKGSDEPKGEVAEILAAEGKVGQHAARKAIDIALHLPEAKIKKIIASEGNTAFRAGAVEARQRKLKAEGKKEPKTPKRKKPEVDKTTVEYVEKRFKAFLKKGWPSRTDQRKVREVILSLLKD